MKKINSYVSKRGFNTSKEIELYRKIYKFRQLVENGLKLNIKLIDFIRKIIIDWMIYSIWKTQSVNNELLQKKKID